MDIIEALKETGMVSILAGCEDYAFINEDGVLCWDNKGSPEPVPLDLIPLKWRPYRKEPQIVPKEAGEVWVNDIGIKWFICFACSDQSKGLVALSEQQVFWNIDQLNMVHGKNGWTRLFPKVEDPNIERVELDNVTWIKTSRGITDFISPMVDGVSLHNMYMELIEERGKLTFEWNKEGE
jgi:hypothetical protein